MVLIIGCALTAATQLLGRCTNAVAVVRPHAWLLGPCEPTLWMKARSLPQPPLLTTAAAAVPRQLSRPFPGIPLLGSRPLLIIHASRYPIHPLPAKQRLTAMPILHPCKPATFLAGNVNVLETPIIMPSLSVLTVDVSHSKLRSSPATSALVWGELSKENGDGMCPGEKGQLIDIEHNVPPYSCPVRQ